MKDLWDHPDPFIFPVSVTEADIDSFGHANNAVYLRWLEQSAWAHSAAVGLPEDRCLALRHGMAVRAVRLDLLAAAYLGEALLVGAWVTAIDGRLRATRAFQIVSESRGATLLRGEIDYVCINIDRGRPARMPAEFAERYVTTLWQQPVDA